MGKFSRIVLLVWPNARGQNKTGGLLPLPPVAAYGCGGGVCADKVKNQGEKIQAPWGKISSLAPTPGAKQNRRSARLLSRGRLRMRRRRLRWQSKKSGRKKASSRCRRRKTAPFPLSKANKTGHSGQGTRNGPGSTTSGSRLPAVPLPELSVLAEKLNFASILMVNGEW